MPVPIVLRNCVVLMLLQHLSLFAVCGETQLSRLSEPSGLNMECASNPSVELCASADSVSPSSTYHPDHVTPSASGSDHSAENSRGSDEPYESRRMHAISEAVDNPFSFVSHRANYLLPLAYRRLPDQHSLPAEDRYGIHDVDPMEIQFQLSLQVPVWTGFMGEESFLSFAYTNRSFWQAYTGSGVFRETNHEAEVIATWVSDWEFWGFRNSVTQAGLSHQSNGRGGIYSRGWNRIYTNVQLEKDNYFVALKPWYRLAREREKSRGPDMDFNLGNFEMVLGYRANGYSTSIMLRNNLRSENRGAIELSWGFPITNRMRGIVKYFDGYGESLIDYSTRVQTLGIGLELAPGL